MGKDEITVTSTTDTPEDVDAALAEGTEPDTATKETTEEPEPDAEGEEEGAPAEDEEEEEPPAEGEEAQPKRGGRRGGGKTMQQRIDVLTWQINRERAEREELQRQLQARETPPEAPKPPEFEEPEPNINDYETLEEWQRDVGAWNRRLAKFEMKQELDARLQNVITPEKVQAAQIQQSFESNLTKYREDHPEFSKLAQKMIDQGVPTTPLMNTHFVHAGEMGPKLMHYLALHPDECRRIAALPQGPQLVALGKVESKIEAGALSGRNNGGNRETPPPAAQTASRNRNQPPPEPPNPVGNRGGNAPRNPENMTYAEHKAWRRSQGAR